MSVLGATDRGRDPVRDLESYLRGEYRAGLPLRLTVRVPSATGYRLRDAVVSRLEVASALRVLPLRQRRVVELLFAHERPVDEVARLLGVSARTVYDDRARGLAAMAAVIYRAPD